jgi:hypothetical protein
MIKVRMECSVMMIFSITLLNIKYESSFSVGIGNLANGLKGL